jgi:hypothetical protein
MSDKRTGLQGDAPRALGGRKKISDYTGGWGIAAFVGAVVLIAAVLIFSAAGPDRSRTADSNTNPSIQQPRDSDTGGSKAKIPNQGMPTAPRSP